MPSSPVAISSRCKRKGPNLECKWWTKSTTPFCETLKHLEQSELLYDLTIDFNVCLLHYSVLDYCYITFYYTYIYTHIIHVSVSYLKLALYIILWCSSQNSKGQFASIFILHWPLVLESFVDAASSEVGPSPKGIEV